MAKKLCIFYSLNGIWLAADINDNFKLIWHNKTSRKFSYTTYLAYVQRLPTTDMLLNWGIMTDLRCVLCNGQSENHNHLFLDCDYNTYLWDSLMLKLAIQPTASASLRDRLSKLRLNIRTQSALEELGFMATSTLIYHIWLERVGWWFENRCCSKEVRMKLLEIDVRL